MNAAPWLYLAIALGGSACFWTLAGVAGGIESRVGSLLFYAAGGTPFACAVLLTHLRESAAEARTFWARAFDPRRMSGPWLMASLLLHPALVGAAVMADFLTGGSPAQWSDAARALAGPAAVLSTLFFVFWFGPLPEEIGWRGYALDPLQKRLGALGASLVIGSAWALWHVPLFFLEGTFQHGLGFGSARFWIFSASMIPLSVLMTWVYNHTRRSTLSAVLIHFTGNLTGLLVAKTERLALFELVALSVAAVVVTAVYGPRELGREDR